MADSRFPKRIFSGIPAGAVMVLLACVLNACVPPGPVTPATPKPLQIGLSMDSFVVERWIRDRDVFMSRATELGARVIVQNANESHEAQVSQIEYLMAAGVDVLVVVPNDKVRLADTLRKAKDRKIPVICYDRLVEGVAVDLYVSFNNVRIGELMALGATKATRSGDIMIINGSTSDANSYLYNKGFHNILDPLVKEGRYSIIQESWLKNWSTEEAVAELHKVLDAGKVPKVVIAANDFLAEAVITTLMERSLLDKVKVIGHDGELAACQRVVEGTQYMTIFKPIDALASQAAEAAVALAQGRDPGWNTLTRSGDRDIPTIVLEAFAVQKSNMMDTVIASGFHRYEDVYRNVPPGNRP